MADTIPDVNITSTAYTNINTESGISVGTALILQNKSNSNMFVQIAASQPDADSTDGLHLYTAPYTLSILQITAGETNPVWVRSAGFSPQNDLSVQQGV